MAERIRKNEVRCPTCRMRQELCICSEIANCRSSIQSNVRIVILMHYRELRRTTNTARLAQLVLPDCEIRIRGLRGAPMSTEGVLDASRQSLLLYPTPDSAELTQEYAASFGKPITLVVPDGSWGQAAKVAKRETSLSDVPRIRLPPDRSTIYALRRSTKAEGLATFEAIARALGILEGGTIREKMDTLFQTMVARTLRSRGIRPQF